MSRTLQSSVWLAVGLVSITACDCGGNGMGTDDAGTPSGLVSLEIMPSPVTFDIAPGAQLMQQVTVLGHFDGRPDRDVTADVTLSFDRADIVTLSGTTLRTTGVSGGSGTLTARLGTVTGTAPVTVRLTATHEDPMATLPDDPAGPFDGPADAGRNPSLVYPNDDVLLPANLRKLEVHFTPGSGNTLFAIGFHSPRLDLEVYTRCVTPLNGGCIYALDETVWRYMASSNRGESVQVRVRGTDDAGTGVGTSSDIDVAFAPDDVSGGIYYWTTFTGDDDDTAIMRYDFASEDSAATLFIDQDEANGQCIGCHTLSREGGRMVVASDGSYNANLLLYDVGNQAPYVPFNSTSPSAFSSFSLDSDRFVGVFSDEDQAGFVSYDLNIFSATTGVLEQTIDVGGTEQEPTTHPDWSPDGSRIVYVRGLLRDPSGNPDDASIAYLRRTVMYMVTNTGGMWGAPVALSTRETHQANYYPTFSPTGDLIVFNHSACPGGGSEEGCNMYDDPTAQLVMMRPEAGAAHVPMTRASAPGVADTLPVVQSTFPKWAPFTDRRRSGPNEGRLQWVTFSSNRNMGLRTPPANATWIWMAAVDPDTGLAGMDPSFPAFLLPFQDLATDNHTAQWAEQIIILD